MNSEEFYKKKHQEWISTSNPSEYLWNIENLLNSEIERLNASLFSINFNTINLVLKKFNEILIKSYKNTLIDSFSGFDFMLKNEQYEVKSI